MFTWGNLLRADLSGLSLSQAIALHWVMGRAAAWLKGCRAVHTEQHLVLFPLLNPSGKHNLGTKKDRMLQFWAAPVELVGCSHV